MAGRVERSRPERAQGPGGGLDRAAVRKVRCRGAGSKLAAVTVTQSAPGGQRAGAWGDCTQSPWGAGSAPLWQLLALPLSLGVEEGRPYSYCR